jgi:hypothetical protein
MMVLPHCSTSSTVQVWKPSPEDLNFGTSFAGLCSACSDSTAHLKTALSDFCQSFAAIGVSALRSRRRLMFLLVISANGTLPISAEFVAEMGRLQMVLRRRFRLVRVIRRGGSVSDRISAMAGNKSPRDVTNCRKCEGRKGLMGLSLIGVYCLEGGAPG